MSDELEVVRNSGDSGRRDEMTDERREHFAAKMFGPAAPHHMTPESWQAVDAAMSVADAELVEELVDWAKAARKLLAENDRLRIELADAELAQTARLREELRTEEQTSYALRKDIERLREALADMARAARGARDEAVQNHIDHMTALRTIERVRVLVDSPRPASKTEVLAALEGE